MAIRRNKVPDQDGVRYHDVVPPSDGVRYDRENTSFDQLARGGAAMKHEDKHGKKHHRAKGGKVEVDGGEIAEDSGEGSGNPTMSESEKNYVNEEAHGKVPNKAHGGGMKKRKRRARGGKIDGKPAHHRMDHGRHRGRAMGGEVGSDRHPLTQAAKLRPPSADKGTAEDNPGA